jgi:hypothetical protein
MSHIGVQGMTSDEQNQQSYEIAAYIRDHWGKTLSCTATKMG